MSNKNYTNYTNYNKKFEEAKSQPIQAPSPAPATEEIPVEKNVESSVEETTGVETNIEETPVETPVKEAPIIGRVANCGKLNVRKCPNKDSEVLCVLSKDSEVIVGPVCNEEWYLVTTSTGIEGYCMKDYVTTE